MKASIDSRLRFDGFCMDEEIFVRLMWHPTNHEHRTRELTDEEKWILPRLIKSLEIAVESRQVG